MTPGYRPYGRKVLVQLDPVVMKIGSIFVPEEKAYPICAKCKLQRTQLTDNPRCSVGEERWGLNEIHDRPVLLETDYAHDIIYIKAPVIPVTSRIGTVLAVGTQVSTVAPGQRIVIDVTAGGSLEDRRLVPEDAILGIVEE